MGSPKFRRVDDGILQITEVGVLWGPPEFMRGYYGIV